MADNLTTPVADGTTIASKDIGGVQYPRNLIVDTAGTDAVGLVTASPAANTLLGRLKDIADAIAEIPGGGGGGGDASAANQTTMIGLLGDLQEVLSVISGALAGTLTVTGPLTNAQLATAALATSAKQDAIIAAIGGATYYPGTQPVSGTVGISGSVAVTGTFYQATQPVSIASSVAVTGTFWQATQPVSAASLPLPTGAATESTLSAASAKLPASLGAKAGSASLSVVPATDAAFTLSASETVIGATAGNADLVDVTLSLDTSAYADGDVLAATQSITNAVRINGGKAMLQSVMVIDEDDQGQPFDLVFLSANQSLGTENSAPSITDAGARDILGFVPVASGDFIDLGGARVATVRNIGLFLEAAGGSRDLYIGAISRGTGTYTASGVRLRLGMIWS